MDTKTRYGSQPLSTRETVYQQLKAQILNLYLVPGTSISEKEMSVEFNVSRTPVRESFLRLAQEGLLNVYPQRGTFVALIDLTMVEEGRFMREYLERAVIRLACSSLTKEHLLMLDMNISMQKVCVEQKDYKKMFELDEAFHKTIFEGCNKTSIWTIIQQMNVHLNRSRMLRLSTNLNWDTIFYQHIGLLEAIKQKDKDQAESLMKEHLTMAAI